MNDEEIKAWLKYMNPNDNQISLENKSACYRVLVSMGMLSINDVRRFEGLPIVPLADDFVYVERSK